MRPNWNFSLDRLHIGQPQLLLLLLTLIACSVMAQSPDEVTASARVSQDRVNIGDVVELVVQLTYPESVIPMMPGEEIELAPFELRGHEVLPPEKTPEGLLSLEAKYQLTVFETGDLEIPALSIPYSRTGVEGEETVQTPSIAIQVESLISEEQGEADIFDIRPPLDFPGSWLFWVLCVLAAAGAAAVAYYLWKRFRKEPILARTRVSVQARPPDEVALSALEKLRDSSLLDQGKIKEFHVSASEIIRQFFEGQFSIDALEMTTDEITRALETESPDREWNLLCNSFLTRCDLVKFAKMKPIRAACEANLESAFEVVRRARLSRVSQLPPLEDETAADHALPPVGSPESQISTERRES